MVALAKTQYRCKHHSIYFTRVRIEYLENFYNFDIIYINPNDDFQINGIVLAVLREYC